MVKKVDSDALGDVTLSLGLSGAGSPETELMDGVVDQVLAINEVARRGRTQQGTGGIYTAILRTVHVIAQDLVSSGNPYNLVTSVLPPWPDPMPRQFDIWLLYASLRRTAGSGTLAAQLRLNFSLAQQGWGFDNGGGAVAGAGSIVLAAWDTIIVSGSRAAGVLNNGNTYQKIGIRLPRSLTTVLEFASTSSELATFVCDLTLGVFPVALGQDGFI